MPSSPFPPDLLVDGSRAQRRFAAQRAASSRRGWLILGVLAGAALGMILLNLTGAPPSPQNAGAGAHGAVGAAGTRGRTAEEATIQSAQEALALWGRFAVSGDMRELEAGFWQGGPQWQLLQREAPKLRREPIGPPPYTFTLSSASVLSTAPGERIVRGTVAVKRPGERDQTFHWDLHMRWHEQRNRWLLWTVSKTQPARDS